MPSKTLKSSRPRKSKIGKNMTPELVELAKFFKGFKAPARDRKLEGKHADAIRRAVRKYYFG